MRLNASLKTKIVMSFSSFIMLSATPIVMAQNTTLVSINKDGTSSGNDLSTTSSGNISADGRFVAFTSKANDLSAQQQDANNTYDVFVRDLRTGTTKLASINASGTDAGNSFSGISGNVDLPVPSTALSANGRFVAFTSAASDLVENDTNGKLDAFVRDLESGITTLVSVNSAGTASGNGNSIFPYLSADGSVVGFRSSASNLVSNDTNSTFDVFVRNLRTRATTLVSVNSAGTASGNHQSVFSTFSADGQIIAFTSRASDLVANDSNGTLPDIFVRNLQTGTTALVSVTADGVGSGNGDSSVPLISANGRFVFFNSRATNLVTMNDVNGTDDVFVRNLAMKTTALVSVNKSGTGTGDKLSYTSFPAAISANGNIIAFVSNAADLVNDDTNGTIADIFIRDVAAGTTKLVSVNSAGTGSGNSYSNANEVSISADGRFLLFDSVATDLVAGGTRGSHPNVFVRDLQQSATALVSHNASRTGGGNQGAFATAISADGSVAIYVSYATDLVTNDTNGVHDVFAFALPSLSCTYSINPSSHTSPAAGETLTVNVSAQGGCNWIATSNNNFIIVTSGASGSGDGTVTLAVASNGSGVPRTGTVTIAGQTFTVTQPEQVPEVPTIQFSQANYQFSEGAGRATLVITRAGNKSATVAVEYLTVDDPAAVSCATANGTAYARCDYATTIDIVTFNTNEESKEVSIPLLDDAHLEGNETVRVMLRNPRGHVILGTPSNATLTITDNDVTGAANPIFMTPFFVRMQYLDFLSREPESGEPWSGVLNRCTDVNADPACDRILVSASFFGSPEFRLKGFFVYNFYKVAFNRLPNYDEITSDMRSVSGTTAAELYARRAAFPVAFTQRAAFKGLYEALTNQQYVEALMERYGLQQIITPDPANPETAAKITMTRGDLINRLSATSGQALTRSQVLRAIVESDEVATQEYNRAFVAMQYYGYLRRTPEQDGYNAWLRVINQDSQNIRVMINGFLNSVEYRLRFGAP